MTSPRIDTTTRQLKATIGLLQLVNSHLTDLHDLAYNRHRAADQAKVRGGTIDYALDNHGDPQARHLLQTISTQLTQLIEHTTTSAHQIITYLNTGHISRRRTTTADATADEILAALAAQHRRTARGEHTPTPLIDQPAIRPSIDHQTELDALTSALRKMHPHQRPDRGRLTPREQQAWRRALDLPPPGKKKRG